MRHDPEYYVSGVCNVCPASLLCMTTPWDERSLTRCETCASVVAVVSYAMNLNQGGPIPLSLVRSTFRVSELVVVHIGECSDACPMAFSGSNVKVCNKCLSYALLRKGEDGMMT